MNCVWQNISENDSNSIVKMKRKIKPEDAETEDKKIKDNKW